MHSFKRLFFTTLSVTTLSAALNTNAFANDYTTQASHNGSQVSTKSSNSYLGFWKTEAKGEETKTATVEIHPCSEGSDILCGKIVGLDEPNDPETNQPKLDKNNTKKDFRNRPIMGLQMISGMKPAKNGGYSKGEIYSPKTGKIYRSSMKLKDNDTLKVKGHVFVFSKTQTWRRTQNPAKTAAK